jgi:hypothetical protein
VQAKSWMMIAPLIGINRLLLPHPKVLDLMKTSGPAKALFGPTPETAAGERGRDLVPAKAEWGMSKQSLSNTDVKRRVHRVCYVGKGKR